MGDNPFLPVLITGTTYRVRKTTPSIQAPSSQPEMAQPSSSKSLAEQSERLLQQTARIFPNKPYTPGITKVFDNIPGGKGADVPEKPRKPDIKHEATKEGGTRAQQPGCQKQKNPRRAGGFEIASTRFTSPRDDLGESRLGARKVLHRGIQCQLLSSMEPPRTP